MVTTWITLISGFVCGLLLWLWGYVSGKRSMRKDIIVDFNSIIIRIRTMLSAGQMAQLDQFLHELTNDEPYVPNVKMIAGQLFGGERQYEYRNQSGSDGSDAKMY